MSTRKTKETPSETLPPYVPTHRMKKPRAPRVRLTHMEIRRGDALRLRIAVADDVLAELGDELGALIKKVAPSTRTEVVGSPGAKAPTTAPAQTDDEGFFVTRDHASDDHAYHVELREYLSAFVESLCDTGLEDAIEIVRAEQARRIVGSN